MKNIIIKIKKEHTDLVLKYGICQTIGGFSNLNKSDLAKASRLDFQYTGLYGELAFSLYRYQSIDKLKALLDNKFETLRPTRKGDNGYDDEITHNNFTRFIDVKSTHITHPDEILSRNLNLVIPQREYHQKMIYVAAFPVGNSSDRADVHSVVLAGWVPNESVTKRWRYDEAKFAVPASELRDLSILQKIF